MQLRDAVVVVTGGGSGIGAALVRRIAAESPAAVVVADLDRRGRGGVRATHRGGEHGRGPPGHLARRVRRVRRVAGHRPGRDGPGPARHHRPVLRERRDRLGSGDRRTGRGVEHGDGGQRHGTPLRRPCAGARLDRARTRPSAGDRIGSRAADQLGRCAVLGVQARSGRAGRMGLDHLRRPGSGRVVPVPPGGAHTAAVRHPALCRRHAGRWRRRGARSRGGEGTANPRTGTGGRCDRCGTRRGPIPDPSPRGGRVVRTGSGDRPRTWLGSMRRLQARLEQR